MIEYKRFQLNKCECTFKKFVELYSDSEKFSFCVNEISIRSIYLIYRQLTFLDYGSYYFRILIFTKDLRILIFAE